MTAQTETTYPDFEISAFQKHVAILQAEKFLQGKASPLVYYPAISLALTSVRGVQEQDAIHLLEAAELRIIQLVTGQMKFSLGARKAGMMKAPKMADLYRRYTNTLRQIMARKGEYALDAQDLIASMYLEQTLPDGELMSPDYIDSYTGAVIVDDLPDIQVPELVPLVIENQAVAADLGWTEKEFNQFILAQNGGFDEADEEDVPEEDRAYTPPTLIQDFVIDPQLQAESWGCVAAFNQARSEVFARLAELHKADHKRATLAEFRSLFTAAPAFLDMLESVARISGEDATTGAAVYLKVGGDYGLTEQDIQDVRVYEDAYAFLTDFLEENEDSILELMQDGTTSPTSERDMLPMIELLEQASHAELERVMPKVHVNPMETASWNIAYVKAMNADATMDEAQGAAWSAWRETMSANGAKAYNEILADTSDRKKAMTAFWRACGPEVPRPRQKIESIRGDKLGLILAGGRQISWAVARLKVEGNELDLSGDVRQRLARKLTEMGIGSQLVALLQ